MKCHYIKNPEQNPVKFFVLLLGRWSIGNRDSLTTSYINYSGNIHWLALVSGPPFPSSVCQLANYAHFASNCLYFLVHHLFKDGIPCTWHTGNTRRSLMQMNLCVTCGTQTGPASNQILLMSEKLTVEKWMYK